MNQRVPYPMQQGHYFERAGEMHRGGTDPLEWLLLAFLLLLILLVIAQLALILARRARYGGPPHMRGGMHGPPGGPDPLTVARMRYARGEIGRDEYVQLAQDLGETLAAEPPAPPA